MRILTHELMNSLSPMQSQIQNWSETITFPADHKKELDEMQHHVRHLVEFGSKFRKFGQELNLQMERFPIVEVLHQAASLFIGDKRLLDGELKLDCKPIDMHL